MIYYTTTHAQHPGDNQVASPILVLGVFRSLPGCGPGRSGQSPAGIDQVVRPCGGLGGFEERTSYTVLTGKDLPPLKAAVIP